MNQMSHLYVTSVTTYQQLTRDRLPWEGWAEQATPAPQRTGRRRHRRRRGPAAGVSGVCQVKALVMTRQSCPPPLDAVLTRMPALAPIGAGIPDFPRKALLGLAGTAARLIHGHPHRLAALSGSKWGVAMASLIS